MNEIKKTMSNGSISLSLESCGISYKMLENLIQLSILYVLTIKQKLECISWIWLIILPIHFLFICLLLITQSRIIDDPDPITELLLLVFRNLTTNTTSMITLNIQLAASTLILLLYVFFLKVKVPLDHLEKYHKQIQISMTLTVTLLMIIQILLPLTLYQIKAVFETFLKNSDCSGAYLVWLSPILIISLAFTVIINSRIRLLGLNMFFLPLFIGSFSHYFTIFLIFMGIVVALFCFIYSEAIPALLILKRNVRKIFHVLILCFFFWLGIELLNGSDFNSKDYFYLFFELGISLVTATVICEEKISSNSDIAALCLYIHQIQADSLKIEDSLHMHQIAKSFFATCKNELFSNESIEKLEQKRFQEWVSKDWLTLVNEMICKEYQSNENLETGILMLKWKLMLNDNICSLLIQLRKLDIAFLHKKLSYRYELMKIKVKIVKSWEKKEGKSTINMPLVLKRVDELNVEFYGEVESQIERINKFWTCIERQNFREVEMSMKVIQASFNRLEAYLKQLQEHTDPKREHHLFELLRFLILNKDQEQSNQLNQNDHPYAEFLEIKSDRIQRISLKMAISLGLQKDEQKNFSISSILPFYHRDILKMIEETEQVHVRIPFYAVLKCFDHTFCLRQLFVHMQLNASEGFTQIYQFIDCEQNKFPLLVYNTERNQIEGYNKNFLTVFDIEQHKISRKIQNQNLSSEEIFKQIELFEENTRNKLIEGGAESEFNCLINIRKLRPRNCVESHSFTRISCIESYKNYMILKIMKGHYSKTQIGMDKPRKQSTEGKGVKLNEESENMKEGCRLENPYIARINNKKIELINKDKDGLKSGIIFLLFISILVFFADILSFRFIDQNATEALSEKYYDYKKTQVYFYKLIKSYKNYYFQHLLKENQDKVSLYGFDAATLQQWVDFQSDASLQQFEEQYLQVPPQKLLQPIPYELRFSNFNISTNTSATNLFDFSQNLALPTENSSLQFLLNNYPTLRYIIMETYKLFDQFDEDTNFQEYATEIGILISCFMGVMLVMLICSFCLLVKVNYIFRDISSIFTLIDKSKLSLGRKKVAKIHRMFKQISANAEFQQSDEQEISSHSSAQLEPECDIVQKQKLIDSTADAKSNLSHSDACYLPKMLFSPQFAIYPLILLSMALFIYLQASMAEIEKKEIFTASKFEIANEKLGLQFLSNIASTYHNLILWEQKGKKDQLFTWSSKKTMIHENFTLPFYKQFEREYKERIEGDLCETTQDIRKQIQNIDCSQLLNGIMKYGISTSIERLELLLRTINKSGVDSLFLPLLGHQYPAFEEILASMEIILSIVQKNSESIEQYREQHSRYIESQNNNLTLLGFFVSLALCLMAVWARNMIVLKCQVGIGYFLILQNQILLDQPVLDYIREVKLLQNISYL